MAVPSWAEVTCTVDELPSLNAIVQQIGRVAPEHRRRHLEVVRRDAQTQGTREFLEFLALAVSFHWMLDTAGVRIPHLDTSPSTGCSHL